MEATLKQYNEMKAKHPDAVLLFRNDNNHPATYDLFNEDAIFAAQVLGLELIMNNDTVKANFIHSSLDIYLPMIVRARRRVAICEQLEDPKLTRKLVKRGITQSVN